MLINYISLKRTIGRLLKEYGLPDTSYIEDIPQWTEDAINIIGISNYYINKHKLSKIEDSRTKLPCDIENLIGVFVVPGFGITTNHSNLRRLFLQNSPYFGKGKGYETLGKETGYGTINGGYLDTSFDKGYVYFAYTGIPLDAENYPLVPKDAHLNTALQYYFINRMSLSGFKHPILDFDKSLQLWEREYPRAGNSINWMDLQEYQDFTELWTNPIIGDLNANNYII